MRIPKPSWKKSHQCWYVKFKGKFHRLDPDKGRAFDIYRDLLSRYNLREGLTADRQLTVRDLLDTYLDWIRTHRAKDTYEWYRQYFIGTCATHKKAKFADKGFLNFVAPALLVRDLKPYHLDNWIDARYPKAGSATISGAMSSVLAALNWAKTKGYIEINPLKGTRRPKAKKRGAVSFLLPEQWFKIIETIEQGTKRAQSEKEIESFMDYIVTLRETGCRPQEIRRVEARHIDHRAKTWLFPLEEKIKGRQVADRVVHLGPVAYQITRKLALRHPDGPLFRNSDDRPWTKYAVANRFAKLSQAVGFKVFAYAVRHTFASEAIIAGVDLITVARLMGHSDLNMLNLIYEHVAKDDVHIESSRAKATERSVG